ncbi:MAG: methyltransferase domain-containing protein [Candidatus Delongbacteria bacterium]|mgnify:CR=1 FL=1|nr:methyltransferase domain-containing protein [Candidatus Delongbacteria bacterium]
MLIKKIINSINFGIARLHKNRRIKFCVCPCKVNLGSGLDLVDNWINIDLSLFALFQSFPRFFLKIIYRYSSVRNWYSFITIDSRLKRGVLIHHNLKYGIPFDDNQIDYIYTSHFLEHIFKSEADFLLQDCYRCLKKGGILRICIPDLAFIIARYLEGDKNYALDNLYNADQDDSSGSHKYMYDFEMIKEILKSKGFTEIERLSFRKSRLPEIERLEYREDDSLYVEAVK